MSRIETFSTRARYADRSVFAAKNPSSRGDRTVPTGNVSDAAVAYAHVNHGRWVAYCPLGLPHGGCEAVDPAEPVFFCCECRNAEVGGDYLRVVFPADRQRDEIETALLKRPAPENRNWQPGETVAALRAENIEHDAEPVVRGT